jgi:CspA family cold shock protein
MGTVSFFNASKGFGFVWPDQGGRVVYVDSDALDRAGIAELHNGQRVSFDIERSSIGPDMAANLAVKTPSAEDPDVSRNV